MGVEERLERIEALLILSNKEVFNTKEAAMFLGISETRLYHLASQREVPYYKRGASNYFKKSELEEWMTQKDDRVKTTSEIRSEAAKHITTHK